MKSLIESASARPSGPVVRPSQSMSMDMYAWRFGDDVESVEGLYERNPNR